MLQHFLASVYSVSRRLVQVAKILPSGLALQGADQVKQQLTIQPLPFMGVHDKGK